MTIIKSDSIITMINRKLTVKKLDVSNANTRAAESSIAATLIQDILVESEGSLKGLFECLYSRSHVSEPLRAIVSRRDVLFTTSDVLKDNLCEQSR